MNKIHSNLIVLLHAKPTREIFYKNISTETAILCMEIRQ